MDGSGDPWIVMVADSSSLSLRDFPVFFGVDWEAGLLKKDLEQEVRRLSFLDL